MPDDFEEIVVGAIDATNGVIRDDQENGYSYEMLYGILLTPEWLERCGYMKYVGNTGQEIYKPPVGSMALYKLAGSKDWIIGANDFSGGYLNLCTISYLHQLQNLYFALTDEELKIKH